MASSRKDHGFTAVRIEGGILPPEFLQTVASLQASQQTGADYGLSKSLVLKEEIGRYWLMAKDLHSDYSRNRVRQDLDAREVGVGKWLAALLSSVFGYDVLIEVESVPVGDRVFNLTHKACGDAVPLLLTTCDFELDKSDSRFGHEGRREAPHGLMQEYLNAEDISLWGIVSNGSKLRILRDNPSLTRPSYIEADLDLIFAENIYSDFAALWLTAHASRLKPADDKPSSCIMEVWRAKAHETGERARENLRHGVTEALRQVGNGFLEHRDNNNLRASIRDGNLSPEQYFQQMLRLVYRMLFLLSAEERDLLHAPDASKAQRAIFADGYSLSRLRERSLRRRHYDRHQDLWQNIQITFRAVSQGQSALGLPALGGLFNSDECPDLDKSTITNKRLLEAVRNLSFFQSEKSLARVNYRDMGTEELGSVYESLLELRPEVNVNSTPWTFRFVGDKNNEKARGSERKLTGSYYTPPALVHELIKSALEPVLAQTVADNPENPRDAILKLKVIDPACGSGHFLLAAARRMAAEIARIESGTDASDETARQHALREVVRHCIYGVDRNPLAVELCKTALWIETIEPGKPLAFLDSHIRHGDSLVGVIEPGVMENGIPGEAYKALTGDEKVICNNLRKRNNRIGSRVIGKLFDEDGSPKVTMNLDDMPEETLDDIEQKHVAYSESRENETRTREELRANLFVGAYFARKTKETANKVPDTEDLNRLKIENSYSRRGGVENTVSELAKKHCFFHWHLEFEEVMRNDGFDAVLGNPPWERIKLQEQEFFSSRQPEIAEAPNKAARDRLIRNLARDDALPAEKKLFEEFETEKRRAEATSQFIRTGERFPLTGIGDVNTYAVFAETFLSLVNPRGRAGLIVPTGIATDDSTKRFFNEIVVKQRLVSLYDFENRKKVFPGIDSRIKFCLLTLSGTENSSQKAEFSFFLHGTEELQDSERHFTLSIEDFTLFNPNTRTCPLFRTRRDAKIARKMYHRAGVLWKESHGKEPDVNPWGVRFFRIFDMANDSGLFKTREQLLEEGWQLQGNIFFQGEERYLPLYEAKLFYQYDHRFATFNRVSARDIEKGKAVPMTPEEKGDFQAVPMPRYWVPEDNVLKRLDKSEIASTKLSRPDPTRPDPTRPDPTRPDPTRPDPTRPDPTRPDPTRPDPTLNILSEFTRRLLSEESQEQPTSARRYSQ